MSTSTTTERPASELVDELKDASAEEVQAILDAEHAREPQPRVTVVRAAEQRLAELAPALALPDYAEVVDAEPDGAWAQLLDDSGEPVLVDGSPVAVPQET